MKIIWKVLISILLLFSTTQITAQNLADIEPPSPREITIAFSSFRPLSFIDNENKLVGFYVDLFTHILDEFGDVDYEIVYNENFSNAFSDVVNNDLDIFGGLLRIPEREDLLYWPSNSVRMTYSTLYTKGELEALSPEILNNKKIGFLRDEASGFKFKRMMSDFGISFVEVYYNTIQEGADAIENGEIFAFVASASIRMDKYSNHVSRSTFLFSPLSGYFTCSINADDYVINIVDRVSERVGELRSNRSSYYWQLYDRYWENLILHDPPTWILPVILFFVLAVLISVIIIRILTSKLRRTNQDLKELNNTLGKRIDIAAREIATIENLASIGRLTSAIAHEVNTPLGVAYTSSTLERNKIEILEEKYKEGTLTEEKLLNFFTSSKEAFNLLVFNLQKAGELISNLKKLSSDQNVKDEIKTFSVPEYISMIWDSIKINYKDKDIKLHIDCDEIEIHNDTPSAFYQVLSNYLVNSFEHGFENKGTGNIFITERIDENGDIFFSYADDGVGMNEEDSKKIWEPFYTTKRTDGHTGLGMATIYSIISKYKARDIKIETGVYKGFKISYTVPMGKNATLTKENGKYIIK